MDKLALFGGNPVKRLPFPAWPVYDDAERKALQEVLESGVWWRTPGTQALEFEREFSTYHDARYGIAVTNGTAALEVALAALGVGPGDEVIIPDLTFVATASAVLFAGALPVPVDVTADTYCIDPDLVEQAVSERTKALIVVHLGGHPADMDRLPEIARLLNLGLVEDCAHAHGTEWRGRKVGSFGSFGTFSFQQSKLMTAGEGGILVTNDDALERRARSVHDCGRMPGEWFYSHFIYGSNYRLSEWQGAVLRRQLARLDAQAQVRTRNAVILDSELARIAGITPQASDPRCTRNGYYAYIFHYDSSAFEGASISRFNQALNAEGIPTQASYPPIHELDLFTSGEYLQRMCPHLPGEKPPSLWAEYPCTARGAWETVWFPQHVLLGSEEEMAQVVEAVLKVQRNAAELL